EVSMPMAGVEVVPTHLDLWVGPIPESETTLESRAEPMLGPTLSARATEDRVVPATLAPLPLANVRGEFGAGPYARPLIGRVKATALPNVPVDVDAMILKPAKFLFVGALIDKISDLLRELSAPPNNVGSSESQDGNAAALEHAIAPPVLTGLLHSALVEFVPI